jgi:hypothetical protein
VYAGPKSEYLLSLKGVNPRADPKYVLRNVSDVLSAFRDYVEAGLHAAIPPERQAQLDVVSDFLDQAQKLLESKGVHPASPAVLVGAALEEFLRTWVESEELSIGTAKPGLDA